MSSSIYLQIDAVLIIAGIMISIVSTYRSILARRVLRRPVHRSHALWTAFISALISVNIFPFAYYELTGVLIWGVSPTSTTPYSSTPLLVLTYILTAGLFLVAFWAWIDQSIEVALDMDFLHRDTLSWNGGVRWVAWAALLVEAVAGISPAASGGGVVGQLYYLVYASLFVYAASVLFLSSRKVKDAAMKSYVKFVGLMVVCLSVVIVTWPYLGVFVIAAYALYRASGSFTKTSPLKPALAARQGVE